MHAFEKQLTSDEAQGYHYVGYHSYAKRRYYEMVQRKLFVSFLLQFISLFLADFEALCNHVPVPYNTTCSWRGFDERIHQNRTIQDWFKGCGCYMIGHS
jgi:hypothetical protein